MLVFGGLDSPAGNVNHKPLLSINGDRTPAQVFVTANAATAYITSNGSGVTTFYYPTAGAGSGTVTSVSVNSANGLSGSVSNPTTTPAITLSTSVTGVLKGDGTSISAQSTGNLSDGTADGISVAGGSGAVLGSGTTITQQAATTSTNGYLTSTDWTTFNSKQASGSYITALTGDGTASGPGSSAMTLATVNSNVGSFSPAAITVNGKGLVTAASSMSTVGSGSVVLATSPTIATPTITGTVPGTTAFSTISAGTVTTNIGASVPVLATTSGGNLTAAATTGSGSTVVLATSPILVTPSLGTPTALVGTNITGTASGLTAGSVTTNANLTGPITSVGNATSIASQTGTGTTFAMNNGPTITGTAAFLTISATTIGTFGYHIEPLEYAAGNSSTSQTINWANGSSQFSTLTGSVTYTFTNAVAGGAYVMKIYTGAGSFTATWPGNVKWAGGSAPTITTAAAKYDVINFYYDGTYFFGSYSQAY